jgi:type IX secretion system PorP/SprF family membrane protein
MAVKKILITLLLISPACFVAGQDTWYGGTAGMRSVFNPAFSGTTGKNMLCLSDYSFLPGGGFNLNSLSAVMDCFVPSLHGGVSAWIVDDFAGSVTNDLRSGVAYSYHFRAGNKVFVTAGLTASIIHIGINSSKVIFPDDIDPFSGQISSSGETVTDNGITRFDTGTGFTVSSDGWYGGLGVSHLSRPYLSDIHQNSSRLHRKYSIEAGTTKSIGEHRMTIQPTATIILQGSSFIGRAGAIINIQEISGGLAAWFVRDGFAALEPSIGWTTGYASLGLTYSYNIANSGRNIPSTALVRASVTFFFNNVEKRRTIHVIKLSEL